MVLIRLEHHEHPAPPQHEMRQKAVLDSGDEIVGTVANLYVDEDSRQLRFVDGTTDDQHYIFLVRPQYRFRVMRYSSNHEISHLRTFVFARGAQDHQSFSALQRRFRLAPIADAAGFF
jgi:PRC-barrel domain protein